MGVVVVVGVVARPVESCAPVFVASTVVGWLVVAMVVVVVVVVLLPVLLVVVVATIIMLLVLLGGTVVGLRSVGGCRWVVAVGVPARVAAGGRHSMAATSCMETTTTSSTRVTTTTRVASSSSTSPCVGAWTTVWCFVSWDGRRVQGMAAMLVWIRCAVYGLLLPQATRMCFTSAY
jgi:hypothetical protein